MGDRTLAMAIGLLLMLALVILLAVAVWSLFISGMTLERIDVRLANIEMLLRDRDTQI